MTFPLHTKLQELTNQYQEIAFLIDFDGTLVDLSPDPNSILVPKGLITDLKEIAEDGSCAVAIITGRSLARLDRFLDGITTTAIGSHGAEYRPYVGAKVEYLSKPISSKIVASLHNLAKKHLCIFENKIFSLSLHLPLTHSQDNLFSEIQTAFAKERSHYFVRKIGRTYEIMRHGITKGSGIVRLMNHKKFSGKKPVYIGDDAETDESLTLITDMGGVLIPVKQTQYGIDQNQNEYPEVSDVQKMIVCIKNKMFLKNISLQAEAYQAANNGSERK